MWQPLHRLPFPGVHTRKRNRYVDEESEDEEEAYKAGRLHSYDASTLQGWTLDGDEEYDDDDANQLAMYGLLPTAVRDVEGEEYVEKYGLKIGHSSIQGHRPTNEDAHLIDVTSLGEGHAATAVFDGHAGPDAGVFASENLIRVLTTNSHWIEYANLPNNKQKSKNVELIKKALIEAYQKIDHELNISDQVQYGIDVSGCTAVTCIITPTHIVCASLGDSRAVVLVKNDGDVHATPLSDDHKPNNPLEKGRIEEAGGFVFGDRVNGELAMSRAIGDFQYKGNKKIEMGKQMVISIPDVAIHKRSSDDSMLLVACDGVFDVFDNYQAVQILDELRNDIEPEDQNKREQKLSELLVNAACDHHSTDNISAIVVSL